MNFNHVECNTTEITDDIKKDLHEICLHIYCIYKNGYGLLNALSFKFVKIPGAVDCISCTLSCSTYSPEAAVFHKPNLHII